MALEVAIAHESDLLELMESQFTAFDNDLYHELLYPGGNNPEARAVAARRTLGEQEHDPSLIFLKCIDTATGKIIGFAKWHIYDKERPESEWAQRHEVDWWEEGRKEKTLAKMFLDSMSDVRERLWQGRPHILCGILCVHADHHGRGAGTALMKWGMDRAQSLGLPCYLEATEMGHPLYQKLGFKDVDVVEILASQWDGDKDRRYPAMIWTPPPALLN
ncbi:hypothetical protein AJ80_04658 [Polytolypa hystricis UAMH7299]|uniref:N-acetyltransferase domain-containing protein n=1 Tax=Polytolypa hystricis (strain UAMH7299) TaxID=1447883 RepID=A0A2B7Y9A9_POLH7|nr:hypothetical protein AJ80_04658 [Polytolypa hystricis UAMH7299]